MANVDISIIIPSKNNKDVVAGIIKKISEETKNLEIEFIVIDMDSTDNSILSALEVIKKNDLRGYVIQSGGGNMSSALNTGIFKSDGKYLTFLYPKRLYKNYISDYYTSVENTNADFVFAVPTENEKLSAAVHTGLNNILAADLVIGLVRSIVSIDFGAIMIKREFLLTNHIRFYEDCNYGYAEAFIYNTLLFDPKIAYADIHLERDSIVLKKEDSSAIINNCFERVEAMMKIYDIINLKHKDNSLLISVFEYHKIPAVIMSCVDILLNNGFGYNAVRNYLHLKHYDNLIKISKITPNKLKRKILKWNTIPWMYRP